MVGFEQQTLVAGAEGLRKPTSLAGHNSHVWWVTFSSDGRRLVSVDGNGIIKIWDVANGKCRGSVEAHDGPIRAAALTPDGKILASVGGSDFKQGEAKLWDVVETEDRTTLKKRADLKGHKRTVLCLAIAPDGKLLATGSWDHSVKLWDIASAKEKRTLGRFGDLVHCVAFSPDGQLLASAGWEAVIRLWDVATGRQRAAYQAHADERVHGLTFSPDGRLLASSSMDKAVKLHEVVSGQERAGFKVAPGFVVGIAFAPDGRTLAAGDSEGGVCFRDLTTNENQCLRGKHTKEIRAVAFRPDGRMIASGGMDARVLLWDEKAMPRRPRAKAKEFNDKELLAAWSDLTGPDAVRAGRAIWSLVAAPDQSVPLIQARLRPEKGKPSRPIKQLIADLDHDDFAARDKAMTELMKLGESAEPALNKAAAEKLSPEARRRVKRLFRELDKLTITTTRAIEVLEHAATPETQRVLRTLADGPAARRATGQAKASLERLKQRSSR
jgi:WD40 repeat protein